MVNHEVTEWPSAVEHRVGTVRVFLERGMKLSTPRRKYIEDVCDQTALVFREPVYAVYISFDKYNPGRIWSIKFVFSAKKPD